MQRISLRFGIFSQRSLPTKRSNAYVTVRSGTFVSLLIALGGRGPLFVKHCRTRSALFDSLIEGCNFNHRQINNAKFSFLLASRPWFRFLHSSRVLTVVL